MCINTDNEVILIQFKCVFVYYYSQQTERRGGVVHIPALYSEVSVSKDGLDTG
jgi:hypothetical protein